MGLRVLGFRFGGFRGAATSSVVGCAGMGVSGFEALRVVGRRYRAIGGVGGWVCSGRALDIN